MLSSLKPLFSCFLSATLLFSPQVFSRETDNYYAWGKTLSDSTQALNELLNLKLQESVETENLENPFGSCHDLRKRVHQDFSSQIRHRVTRWVEDDPQIQKVPAMDTEDYERFQHENIYQNRKLFIFSLSLSPLLDLAPTIKVAGIHLGVDKFGHFFPWGWKSYLSYKKALEKKETPDEALAKSILFSFKTEEGRLGFRVSKIFSRADMEANYRGFLFYLDLCGESDSLFVWQNQKWSLNRDLDFSDYVNPYWDESFNNSIFKQSAWKKIHQALQPYCALRNDPEVVSRHEFYQMNLPTSPPQELILKSIRSGRLANPDDFSIEAACQ